MDQFGRPFSSMGYRDDPFVDTLGMDNSRSYLGGSRLSGTASLSGLDGGLHSGLRDPTMYGTNAYDVQSDDRNRYLASRRFVGVEGSWTEQRFLLVVSSSRTVILSFRHFLYTLKHNTSNIKNLFSWNALLYFCHSIMTAPFALHSIVCINWHKLFYPQFIISLHHKIRFKMHDLDLRVLTELKSSSSISLSVFE